MTEGCEFRDLHDQFEALGVTIYGCSFDLPAENAAFTLANQFQYRLFSDPERAMALHYEAASSPSQWFADRTTVVLDPYGRWVLQYPSVGNTKAHPNEVLADMTALVAANPEL